MHGNLSVILFFVLAVAGCVQPTQQNQNTVSTTPSLAAQPLPELSTGKSVAPTEKSTTVPPTSFSCENDPSVTSRGYVLLMGLGDHGKDGWRIEKELMEKDPKAKFAIIYDQDETKHIDEISDRFVSDLESWLQENPVEEIVLFGSSAGGVTAAYSLKKITFPGKIVLHTIASPLKGYDMTGFRAAFLGDREGYLRDIAIGFDPFPPPGKNVKVYHHKTVKDTTLVDHYCGGVASFCDAKEIQNNNLEGSQEFFYPQYDHDPIMPAVVHKVLKCYNPALTEGELSQTVFASKSGMEGLCPTADECDTYCQTYSFECETHCMAHPENIFCQQRFAFVYEDGYQPLTYTGGK